MRLYIVDRGDSSAVELVDITFNTVTKAFGGGGVAQFSRRDFENSGIANWQGLLWETVEIRKNDGSTVLWEGYITNVTIDRNSVIFTAIEGLRALDMVPAEYTSIEHQGKISSISGDVITDRWASYTNDELIGLLLHFTDSAGSAQETVWPHADTAFIGSPDVTSGTHADLVAAGSTGMYCTDGDATSPGGADTFGLEIVWLVPEFADSTRVEIHLMRQGHSYYYYPDMITNARIYTQTSEHPLITIYNDTTSTWESASDNVTGIGRIAAPFGTLGLHIITITQNIGLYFDVAGVIKLRIVDGDPQANYSKPAAPKRYYIGARFAALYNTYEPVFQAEDITFTITDNTATTITLDSSAEDAGVGVNDTYTIGGTMSDILPAAFESAGITAAMTLDMDSTSLSDATDYRFAYIGDMITNFAGKLGRRAWQQTGWVIKLKTSANYVDTGIDLTEANLDVRLNSTGWQYSADGNGTVRKVIVSGGGGSAEAYSGTSYDTIQGLIINDATVTDQTSARARAAAEASYRAGPVVTFRCTLDCDSGITSIANLDIGKLIDINLFSSAVVISQGLITEVSYEQNKGGHLLARITVEVV